MQQSVEHYDGDKSTPPPTGASKNREPEDKFEADDEGSYGEVRQQEEKPTRQAEQQAP